MSILSANVALHRCPISSRDSNKSSGATSPNGKGQARSSNNLRWRFGQVTGGWTSSRFPPPYPSPLASPPPPPLELPTAAVKKAKEDLQLSKTSTRSRELRARQHQRCQSDQFQSEDDSSEWSPATIAFTPDRRGSSDWELSSLDSPHLSRRLSGTNSLNGLSSTDDSMDDSLNTPRTPVAGNSQSSKCYASPFTPRYHRGAYDQSDDNADNDDEDDDADQATDRNGSLSPLAPRSLDTPEEYRHWVDGLDGFHLPPAATDMISLPSTAIADDKWTDSSFACTEATESPLRQPTARRSIFNFTDKNVSGHSGYTSNSHTSNSPKSTDRHRQLPLDDLVARLHHTHLDSKLTHASNNRHNNQRRHPASLHRAASEQHHYRRLQPHPHHLHHYYPHHYPQFLSQHRGQQRFDERHGSSNSCRRPDKSGAPIQLARASSAVTPYRPNQEKLRRVRSSSSADVASPSCPHVPRLESKSPGASDDVANRVTWFHINCRHRPVYS